MRRGEIWWAVLPFPSGRRPVVLVSRNLAYKVRSKVSVIEVTTRARGLEIEIPLGGREGLPKACWGNADNIATIDKAWLEERIGALGREKVEKLDRALGLALVSTGKPKRDRLISREPRAPRVRAHGRGSDQAPSDLRSDGRARFLDDVRREADELEDRQRVPRRHRTFAQPKVERDRRSVDALLEAIRAEGG